MNQPALQCFLDRAGKCPPAMRVVIAGDLHRPPEQHTVWRADGEPDAAFYARAQAAGHAMQRLHGFARWVYLECAYAPSEDMPDDKINLLRALRHTINNEADNIDVRLAAIKVVNRVWGLVPADAGW